jgi:hypothetical protein
MRRTAIFTFATLSLFCYSCLKHENNPDDNKEFPITLDIKQSSAGIEVSWTKTNISNFREYKVFRSLDSLTLDANADTTWIVDNLNNTKIIDGNLPITDKVFYRVIASSTNLTLKSAIKSYFRADLVTFRDITFTTLTHNAAKNLIYAFNKSFSGEIRVLDLDKRTKSAPISVINSSGSSSVKLVASIENPDNTYLINFEKVSILDPLTLAEKKSFSTPNFLAITDATGFGDLIYFTQQGTSKTLDVYDGNNKANQIVYAGTNSNFFASTKIVKYLSGKKRVYVFDNSTSAAKQALQLDLNKDGIPINNGVVITKTTPGALATSSTGVAVSPNGNSLIVGSTVYDSNLEVLFTLPSMSSLFASSSTGAPLNFCYSPDGNHLAYRTASNNIRILDADTFDEVYNFKIPNVTVTNSLQPRFNSFYITNNQLIAVSTAVNSVSLASSDIIISKYTYN